MKNLLIIGCLLISACSSDSTSTQTPPITPVIKNVEVAEIDIASNNCVMRSNAEAEFTYPRGSELLMHMIWNCADYDFHRESFVEVLAEYDTVDACYKIVDEHIDTGVCSSVAKAPDTIDFNASITDFGFPVSNGVYLTVYLVDEWGSPYSGDFGLLGGPTIKNIGNVRIFGLKITMSLDGQAIMQATMSNESLPPYTDSLYATAWYPVKIAPIFFDTPIITSGGQYTVTLTLRDLYGNILETRTATAEAQF